MLENWFWTLLLPSGTLRMVERPSSARAVAPQRGQEAVSACCLHIVVVVVCFCFCCCCCCCCCCCYRRCCITPSTAGGSIISRWPTKDYPNNVYFAKLFRSRHPPNTGQPSIHGPMQLATCNFIGSLAADATDHSCCGSGTSDPSTAPLRCKVWEKVNSSTTYQGVTQNSFQKNYGRQCGMFVHGGSHWEHQANTLKHYLPPKRSATLDMVELFQPQQSTPQKHMYEHKLDIWLLLVHVFNKWEAQKRPTSMMSVSND